VRAAAIHSRVSHELRDARLDQIASGELEVLVNVALLTHGVDLPAVRSLFMVRPTASDILYSQMIGRGARKDAATGKTSFTIVEFTDNLERFEDVIVTAKRFLAGA
jgi:ATP-dependent helicase IRC3